MMGYGYGMNWGFGMIIPVILIGLVIYAIVRFSQTNHKNDINNNLGNDGLDILNKRYANGEISEEEYIQKKKQLKD